ncbi:MAG: alpha/beta fold hydrolase [Pseudohongiellaceae bacterium]|nr:alpha/beta fold hydrolase [Pseudohongiellaceae bacterium]
MIFIRFKQSLLAKRTYLGKQAQHICFSTLGSITITTMYPEIDPFYTHMLPVGTGHSIYVERSGRKGGCPIFFIHGGPGSRTLATHRRYFDPDFYDIVLFDQRGCGQSEPLGEVQGNDLAFLVEDINAIRAELKIDQAINLFGGSWGSTVALAYAMSYPDKVQELILRGVFLGSEREVKWFTNGVSRFAPKAWELFSANSKGKLLDYYYEAVNSNEQAIALAAARSWCEYEARLMRIGASEHVQNTPISLPSDEQLLARVRIQLHFLHNRCFLKDNQLMTMAYQLKNPVTIVQGEQDFICPPSTAYQLHQQLPHSTLRLIPGEGHNAVGTSLAQVLCDETDQLRDRIRMKDEPAF